MTPDEFTRQLPKLTNNPLPIKPPFLFNGVSVRIFPLRANLDALQQLCDGYLNFVPPEAGQFRVAMPYVSLMVLDYGQVSEAVTRIGWFAQTEVFFSVPVEWYKLVAGQWVFQDWAVITPYIFVNDSFSMPLGRTVYGFTKVLAKMTRAPNQWIKDPVAPVTLARVKTAVFPEAYAGKRIETRVFLEIERDAPMTNFRMPTDPLSPIMPWVVASNFAKAVGGFGRDAMWIAQAMRIFPINPGTDPAVMSQMLARLAPMFAPGGSGFVQNSLNLKQFRRADDPDSICFQSLTLGQMRTTGFNDGGLLGEERTFLGDLSGGHTVRLYDYPSLPIARTLGLEIHRQWTDGDGSVLELKPLLPSWINIDLFYDQGQNLAWRTKDGGWKDASGAPLSPGKTTDAETGAPPFNSAVTSAIEAIAGPFEFSGTTIRVLPLLARIDKLQGFLDRFINQPLADPILGAKGKEKARLSVWARPKVSVNEGSGIGGGLAYVYLTASSFEKVISKTNNVGDWAKYELSFMIPVKWERWNSPEGIWDVMGVGLVPAYTLVDNCIAAISRSEIQGIDARTASFVRPESVWLEEGQSNLASKQTFLRVDAEVWPAFGAGQKARIETVIEISNHEPNAGLGDVSSRSTPFSWAETLLVELGTKKGTEAAKHYQCKIARALALELLGNQSPFALYTLKQFRDVHDPDKACYQELVRVPRVLKEIFDIREIEETLVVRLHDFPSLNIAADLGILGPTVQDSGTGIVHSAQAVRPFYIRATVSEPLAERLLSRSGTPEWSISSEAFQCILSDEEGSPPIDADIKAESFQNQLDSCCMTAMMYQARERRIHNASPWAGFKTTEPPPDFDFEKSPVSQAAAKAAAREALSNIDPQMVIEAALSREWGNADESSRWRRGYRELVKLIDALPSGSDRASTETKVYRYMNDLMAIRPGAVANRLQPELERPGVEGQPYLQAEKQLGELKRSGADVDYIAERLAAIQGEQVSSDPTPWQKSMEGMILMQRTYAACQLELETAYNAMAPWLMLGILEFTGARKAGEEATPTQNTLQQAALRLVDALDKIRVLWGPGLDAHESSDWETLKDVNRLNELLVILNEAVTASEVHLEHTGALVAQFLQAVDLARKHCGVYKEALLNKLSRAYQKPDFCIRRDSIGLSEERLLANALLWDEDWYYGG